MMNLQVTLYLILTVGSFAQQATASNHRHYELGTSYSYRYTSIILLNEPPPLNPSSNRTQGTDVGYQIAASIDVRSVWQEPLDSNHLLLEILVKAPKLSIKRCRAPSADGFIPHSSSLDEHSESSAVYLDWNYGKISRIFAASSETSSSLNMKKGVASLFQVQDSKGEAKELDSSGRCSVTYQETGDVTLLKKKRNCQFQHEARSQSFVRAQKILGVTSVTENQWKYDLKKDTSVIQALTATEVHSARVTLRSQAGASVISRQFLHLSTEEKTDMVYSAASVEEAIEEISKACGIQYVENNLQLVEEPNSVKCEGDSCLSFGKAVSQLKNNLQSLASSSAADAFVSLVSIVRRSSKADILAVLTNAKNKKILPQLLDVIAAAQTADAHQAAIEVVNFKSSSDIELPERYLVAVSMSTHPSEFLLKDLLALCRKNIPNENLAQSATLSLAAVTRTFQNIQKPNHERKPIVSEIHLFLLDRLESCKTESCRQLYLRSLKNLAIADTLPVILKYIDGADRKTSVTAVKALRALPSEVFDRAVKDKLEKIYFQIGRRYDSSARTLVLDMLLEHEPTSEFLTQALISMSSADSKELSTYTLQRVMEFAGNNPSIHAQIKQILKENPAINNYHALALDGQSTAFTRLMYRDANGNGTFSSSNEVMSGVMKRSAFDIFLSNPEDSFQLLSFGLFTGGLASMMGGSSDGDDEDATAGMEISLAGVQLRPLIFFTGQGELMGHIWSGTASDRTSALQATVLLQDHRQLIPLQSGFIAVMNVLGSVSFDFGGEIQISIWNRNSHSVVDNMAAWGLEGSLSLNTAFIKSEVEFKVGAEAKIDFVSDVSFGGDLMACLRMGQNGFLINHAVRKRESIPGTKHWIHKKRTRQEVIPGRTYALNAKNSVLCNEMFAN